MGLTKINSFQYWGLSILSLKQCNIVTGDNPDSVIDLGYEKYFHNGLSDYDNESLYIPIVLTLSE